MVEGGTDTHNHGSTEATMPTSREPYCTIDEVCGYLGASKRTVQKAMKSKTLPFYRPFKEPLFRLSEVDKVVQATRWRKASGKDKG